MSIHSKRIKRAIRKINPSLTDGQVQAVADRLIQRSMQHDAFRRSQEKREYYERALHRGRPLCKDFFLKKKIKRMIAKKSKQLNRRK